MEYTIENEKERMLWRLAKKRVSFKRHIATYIVVNLFLWILWFIGDREMINEGWMNIPWPFFCTLGWGVGMVFKYLEAFVFSKPNAIDREFEKLKSNA